MPNRLAESASPYLLQHAENPVDWYEWGDAAFEEARRRDVPLLVSIGYSACHWCHVMAHESFEDPATAEQMNSGFVNVKVDREERPDVDAVYMEATQAMTGHGGWPMTVFVDHDGSPFFTGTYFPPADRQGMPGFRSVLSAVEEAWRERRSDVSQQARRVTEALGRRLPPSEDMPGESALVESIETLSSQFDSRHGGFGGAPKFPQQPVLEFLLRAHDRSWAGGAAAMVRHTLAAMAAGGIRDHLGGGFARYSVDARWLVPHFEKMLYDNAQLARLYLWAGVEFASDALTEVAIDTLEYLLSDLRHPEGGFFSAEDADSEGVEGKFYVWSHDEFVDVVGDDAPVAAAYFGVTPQGNFEGANILHRARGVGEVAADFGIEADDVADAVQRAGRALLERRAQRVRPGLDDKVVTAWNGLAIRAFAEAGAVLSEPRYLDAARNAARFVLSSNRDPEGGLRRSSAKGRLGPPAVLEDYAGLAVGLFALYAASGEIEWYDEAVVLVESLSRFADTDGGFFTTAEDGDRLVVRPKDLFDNPAPSGNSLAAEALILASSYRGDPTQWEVAEDAVRSAGSAIERAPSGVGHLLGVLLTILDGPRELGVVGPEATELAEVAWEAFRPGLVVAKSSSETDRPPLLEGRGRSGETLAYLCRRFACEAPVTTADELRTLLDQSSAISSSRSETTG
ncbi:MAG TPA: thioredoxin domain-containing protein [Acidimicrobiia bacterium]|nr:thioredoxin domain-containing protein [Acidimicrobiia bacterium]